MNGFSSRRGSALLIVLGMLSFMVVSAVGFAAYMRYARLPSSYLRRTASSRMLAKAAVAEAIDAVDRAVCNNPHPGVGCMWVSADRQRSGIAASRTDSNVRNIWWHRVLLATNDTRLVTQTAPRPDSLDYETVSPLCLEALAYMPPPLVNEARCYSRLSPTATWQSLPFDAGRFAYVALDVSDYFDVNRLMADMQRSSSPAGRISLSYLFENQRHTASTSAAAQWDTFMEGFRKFDEDTLSVDFSGKYPLVSIADFNLALGRKGSIGNFKSPFYNYVKNGGTTFYGTSSLTEEENIRRMTFVTDGLFPQDGEDWEEGGSNAVDLDICDSKHQPFAISRLETKSRTPTLSESLMGQGMNDQTEWRRHIGRIGCAALFDYLDTDHIPCSLALPVTERVPMICGISPDMTGSKFSVTKDDSQAPTGVDGAPFPSDPLGEGQTAQAEAVVLYKINGTELARGLVGSKVNALALFPFAHPDENDGSFSVDGRFSLFFSTGEMRLRTANPNDVLHLDNKNIAETAANLGSGLLNIKLQQTSISPFTNISKPEDALRELDGLNLRPGTQFAPQLAMAGNELLRVTYRWTMHAKKSYTAGFATYEWDHKTLAAAQENAADTGISIVKKESAFSFLDASGRASQQFLDSVAQDSGPEVRLNAAVWLRILDGTDVVDMVPACLLDDKTQNNVSDAQMIYQGLSGRLGQAYPLMKFDTGVVFTLSLQGLDDLAGNGTDIVISPKTVMVADPRFNHAPESWFQSSAALSKTTWMAASEVGQGARDGDFFLSTSDAGYLQSKWELAMLPRFTNLDTFGSDETIGNLATPNGANMAAFPNSFADSLNNGFMWRSYDPFDLDEAAFADLPWKNDGTGFKINPYSDCTNIVMAAFANTPLGWKQASTNNAPGTVDYAGMTAEQFNRKYAFNEYASDTGSRISWETLEDIAGRFMWLVRDKANRASPEDWTEAWQDMGWGYVEDEFCTIELDAQTQLWTTDRKFLYGFWRDCFAPKQQLYLVFARAEPVMMGGDAAGQIPPQLGARAMALVWRDPYRVKDDKYPHQTRVLFYRQFD